MARLIAHLDGMPLAIELAAAALADRPLSACCRGHRPFRAAQPAAADRPGRHQTLRAALEWSLDLLSPVERRVFTRLAVFAGHGTLDAAGEVCAGAPVPSGRCPRPLRRLMRASLLVPHPGGRRPLVDARVGAGTRPSLEPAAADAEAAARHRAWFAARAEALGPDSAAPTVRRRCGS